MNTSVKFALSVGFEMAMALDAFERAEDLLSLMCDAAESEGRDPETDHDCGLAWSRRNEAKLRLRSLYL